MPVKLEPPDDMSPEAYLEQFDANPTLIPQWPRSARIALVCVRATGTSGATEGAVILSPEELKEASNPNNGLGRLFFRVPVATLLRDGACPGLTPDMFWKPDAD